MAEETNPDGGGDDADRFEFQKTPSSESDGMGGEDDSVDDSDSLLAKDEEEEEPGDGPPIGGVEESADDEIDAPKIGDMGNMGDDEDDVEQTEETQDEDSESSGLGLQGQSDVFRGYNTDEPEDVIEAINKIESSAAKTIEQVYHEREKSRSEVEALSNRIDDIESDFQQYKVQKDRQISALKETAAKDFIKDILPVREDMARAVDAEDASTIREGIEITLKKFDKALTDEGVTIIEPQHGDDVDPNVHEVMSTVSTDDVPEGKIIESHRPGYRIGDLVLRPARVTVSE